MLDQLFIYHPILVLCRILVRTKGLSFVVGLAPYIIRSISMLLSMLHHFLFNVFVFSNSELCHRRLGHVQGQWLKKLIKSGVLGYVDESYVIQCSGYKMAKFYALSYPTPYLILFIQILGVQHLFLHFLVIDTMSHLLRIISRFVWVYLIRQCCEIFEVYANSANMVYTQFMHGSRSFDTTERMIIFLLPCVLYGVQMKPFSTVQSAHS